jgi:hypothetical protein
MKERRITVDKGRGCDGALFYQVRNFGWIGVCKLASCKSRWLNATNMDPERGRDGSCLTSVLCISVSCNKFS